MAKTTQWIEKRFSKRPPSPEVKAKGLRKPIENGDHIVVIGGGIAGSAFARRFLSLASKQKKSVKLTIVNSTSCNHCGGLITDLALKTFNQVYELDVPEDVVLTKIKEGAYINSQGSFDVTINIPMIGMLRTSKFGAKGFDDSFKERILEGLPNEVKPYLELIEPTIATHILPQPEGQKPWKIVLSLVRMDEPVELMADFVVLAGGLKMIDKPLMMEFQNNTGYQPPPTIPAGVTEIDTSQARKNIMEDKLYIIDGIIPGAVLGLISKGKNWLSLTSLGKQLTMEDLDYLFSHPEVKKHLDLPQISERLRCGVICPANVYSGPAKNFFGDKWAAIGDLNGLGRVLKDGYLASLESAKLVADTMMYVGTDKESLHQNYFLPIRKSKSDNTIGIFLYNLNQKLSLNRAFCKFLISSAQAEKKENSYGGPIHAAIRSLMTGELPYGWIIILFVIGLMRSAFTPWNLKKR